MKKYGLMIVLSGVVVATAVSAEIDCSISWDTACGELGYIYKAEDVFVNSDTECKSAPEPDCYEGRLVCPMADDSSMKAGRTGKAVYSSVMEITGDDLSGDTSSCEVGDYIIKSDYNDDMWNEVKCSKDPIPYVKGVVFDPANNLALSYTKPSTYQWATKNFYTAYECKFGKYSDKECYYNGGVLTGEAIMAGVTGAISKCPAGTFLPSIQQMKALYRNKRRVQNSLNIIDSFDLDADKILWTSNSYKTGGYVDSSSQITEWTVVYTFNMKDGTVGTAARYYENDYICIGSYSLK